MTYERYDSPYPKEYRELRKRISDLEYDNALLRSSVIQLKYRLNKVKAYSELLDINPHTEYKDEFIDE